MQIPKPVLAAALAALLAGACSGDDDEGGGDSGPPPDANILQVVAAAPAEAVVRSLVDGFEASPEGGLLDVTVEVEALEDVGVAEAAERAATDVVIAPDAWIEGVLDDAERRPFGEFRLVVVVPTGNPAGAEGLAAFGDAGLRTAICGRNDVAVGLILGALTGAGVTSPTSDSLAGDCTPVLERLRSGDLDAALVFRTDALADGGEGFEIIDVPDDENLVFSLSSVVAGDDPAADAFADYVDSAEGTRIRTEAGYLS